MADTTIYLFGDKFKVKAKNETMRLSWVEAYQKRVEDLTETDAMTIHVDNGPTLIVPVTVLREQTYLETI